MAFGMRRELQVPDQTFGAILYFLVIPLNFVLVVIALLDVTRRPAWQIPLWWRAFWGLLILVVWVVGPAAYLIWRTRLPPANQGARVRRRRGRGGGKRRRR